MMHPKIKYISRGKQKIEIYEKDQFFSKKSEYYYLYVV